jgi:pimeloyl-ACP methyl ester carboxylesterase
MNRRTFFFAPLGLLAPFASGAAAQTLGKYTVALRGKPLELEFYPAAERSGAPRVLFAPGDLGMLGFAVTIAQTIASWGYDVHGLDTRRYLESFTGKVPLTETNVMADFHQIGDSLAGTTTGRITLVGWSEGAGLCLLAAAAAQNKELFNGLVTLGMTETNALSWRWSDFFGSVGRRFSFQPEFPSAPYLPQVAPLPLLMIQSSQDQYITVDAARRLFALARDPKRFVQIEAHNHRFEGNQEELFRTIREGLVWIRTQTA